MHSPLSYGGPVATVQVANGPAALIDKNLGVLPAGLIFANHDLIGWRPAYCDGSARNEPKNIGPFGAIANDQISHIGHVVHLLIDFLIFGGRAADENDDIPGFLYRFLRIQVQISRELRVYWVRQPALSIAKQGIGN
jgi:hypothetical protein